MKQKELLWIGLDMFGYASETVDWDNAIYMHSTVYALVRLLRVGSDLADLRSQFTQSQGFYQCRGQVHMYGDLGYDPVMSIYGG